MSSCRRSVPRQGPRTHALQTLTARPPAQAVVHVDVSLRLTLFSGLKTFLSHHCYEGTVSFLPAQHTVGSPRDRKPCRAG